MNLKSGAAALALALATGCAHVQYLHGGIDALPPNARAVCARFAALSGENRLREARAVGSLLPQGWESKRIPFRFTEQDVADLLGKPDQVMTAKGGRVGYVYTLLPHPVTADGQLAVWPYTAAKLVVVFRKGVITGSGLATES